MYYVVAYVSVKHVLYNSALNFFYSFIADPKSTIGRKLPIALVVYSIVVSYAYIIINDPVFHQVAYGLLVVTVVCRAVLLLGKVPETYIYEKPRMKALLLLAALGFIIGFTFWNIDNIFCSALRDWRQTVPTLTGSVSEV
jgi:dihydroceramidase